MRMSINRLPQTSTSMCHLRGRSGVYNCVYKFVSPTCFAAGSPAESQRQVKCKPKASQMQAKGKPKASQRQAEGKPKASQRQAKGKPKASQRKAKGKPKESERKAKGKPKFIKKSSKCHQNVIQNVIQKELQITPTGLLEISSKWLMFGPHFGPGPEQ